MEGLEERIDKLVGNLENALEEASTVCEELKLAYMEWQELGLQNGFSNPAFDLDFDTDIKSSYDSFICSCYKKHEKQAFTKPSNRVEPNDQPNFEDSCGLKPLTKSASTQTEPDALPIPEWGTIQPIEKQILCLKID